MSWKTNDNSRVRSVATYNFAKATWGNQMRSLSESHHLCIQFKWRQEGCGWDRLWIYAINKISLNLNLKFISSPGGAARICLDSLPTVRRTGEKAELTLRLHRIYYYQRSLIQPYHQILSALQWPKLLNLEWRYRQQGMLGPWPGGGRR